MGLANVPRWAMPKAQGLTICLGVLGVYNHIVRENRTVGMIRDEMAVVGVGENNTGLSGTFHFHYREHFAVEIVKKNTSQMRSFS